VLRHTHSERHFNYKISSISKIEGEMMELERQPFDLRLSGVLNLVAADANKKGLTRPPSAMILPGDFGRSYEARSDHDKFAP
jgi:hypothetical protein